MTVPSYVDYSSDYDSTEYELPKLKYRADGDNICINKDGSSWLISGVILANIVLGMGLLNMPEAYKDAGGVINAVFTQMVCVIFIISGYIMIVECSEMNDSNTYQDVLYQQCGKWALVLCSITIFIHNFGTCITFLVLLADQMDDIMKYAYGPDFCDIYFLRRSITMPICSVFFILPFCFVERFDGKVLKIISVIGVVSTGYVIFLVMYKYYSATELPDIPWSSPQWTDTLNAVPVICYSFEGHIEAVPLYYCLKRRTPHEFSKTITVSTILCLLVYTTVGIYGYLHAGNDVTSDVLLSYYPADVFVIVGTAIVALKSVTTYPGVFFCARLVVDDMILHCCQKAKLSSKHRRMLQAIFFFCVSVVLALVVPTIGSIIKLLGGSAALFIMVFPGLCYMQAHVNYRAPYWKLKVFWGLLMVILGLFLASASTVRSIQIYSKGNNMRAVVCGLL